MHMQKVRMYVESYSHVFFVGVLRERVSLFLIVVFLLVNEVRRLTANVAHPCVSTFKFYHPSINSCSRR